MFTQQPVRGIWYGAHASPCPWANLPTAGHKFTKTGLASKPVSPQGQKSLLRSRKSQVIIGNNKTSTKMPNVQIHTQRHLLGSENRCEGIARGIWRPGARLDQPRRRRKASLPCRANGAHGMTSGISGEVGECRGWGSTSTCELVFKGLRAQAVGSKHVPYALTGAAL